MNFPKREYVSEPEITKVYTINVHIEPEIMWHKEFTYMDNEALATFDGDKIYRNLENKVEVARAKQFAEVVDGTLDSVYISKQLIIVEPKLERILSEDYRNKIKELEEKLTIKENLLKDRVTTIDLYNNLPWWKKLFTFTIYNDENI